MVTTDRADLAENLRRFRNHGISSDARQRHASGQWHYEMVQLGFNYRLTDIACALGISQLKKLEANLARRREIAARYTAAFRNLRGVIAPSVRSDVNPAWHLYPIRIDYSQPKKDRAYIFRALRANTSASTCITFPCICIPTIAIGLATRAGNTRSLRARTDWRFSMPRKFTRKSAMGPSL